MGVALRMLAVGAGLAAAWFVCLLPFPGAPDGRAVVDGPVIAEDNDWDAHPTAVTRGYLRLRHGCLLLGGAVVVWHHLAPRTGSGRVRRDFEQLNTPRMA